MSMERSSERDEAPEVKREREEPTERTDDGWGHDEDITRRTAPIENREAAITQARDAVERAYDEAPKHLPEMPDNLRGAEREQLSVLPVDGSRPLHEEGHINDVRVIDTGDTVAYAKPASGEADARRDIPQGEQFRREVATGIVDEALHFDVVPATVIRHDESLGDFSLQSHAPRDAMPVGEYDHRDQQRMAVLDYVTGQTDRHSGNYRSQDDGRPAAIDNGLTFPESNNDPLRSSFFESVRDQELDPDVMKQVGALDQARLEDQLRQVGISENALKGFRDRLDEVRTGRVTGRAYGWDLMTG